jgi:hypothetical protein
MSDIIVVGNRAQAFALSMHHAHHFLFLVRCQLGFGPELYPSFLRLGPAAIGATRTRSNSLSLYEAPKRLCRSPFRPFPYQ